MPLLVPSPVPISVHKINLQVSSSTHLVPELGGHESKQFFALERAVCLGRQRSEDDNVAKRVDVHIM